MSQLIRTGKSIQEVDNRLDEKGRPYQHTTFFSGEFPTERKAKKWLAKVQPPKPIKKSDGKLRLG